MDMQNVSNLQIPEGAVRTIHDKDSRLIWGRVAYNTKYAGNTLQNGTPAPDTPVPVQVATGAQTVEVQGKNLLGLDNFSGSFSSNQYTEFGNILDIKSAYGIAASLDVTLNSFKYTKTSQYDSNQKWNFKGLQPNTNYTVSCNYSITTSSATRVYLFDTHRAVSGNSLTQSFTTNGNGEKEFTLQFYGAAQNDTIELTNLMVEQGSTATAYEPYQSQSYTISLGSLELCKIGDYQDYIYKSGADWYVHKETNSLTVTSSMSGLGKSGTSANNAFYLTSQFGDIDRSGMGQGASSTTVTPSYSKYFTIKSAKEVFNSDTVGMAFDIYTGTLTDFRVGFGLSSSVNTLNLFKTWLDNNLLKVYYPLAAPADTQITDTVLISQLNAAHEWMTRYGYNSVVTGNLPIIIDRTNL